MKSNSKQVGGKHYSTRGLQHWDAVYEIFGGDYLIGNATKYLARLGKKGDYDKSIEDLEKAIHYLEKKLEMMKAEKPEPKTTIYGGGTFPHVGSVPPSNPVTLADVIRKELRYEGLEDSGDPSGRYTNQ